MLNKMNSIYNSHGFITVINEEKWKILKRNNDDKFEYFVIVALDDLNNILEETQLAYLTSLKKVIQDKEVDKNSTLLICLKSEILPLETNIYKKILAIEEDPYYFRKLVLPYTQQQLNLIENIDDFETIIKDPNSFEGFRAECKENTLTTSLYEIVSQLYIKLPFLKFPIVSGVKNILLDEYKNSLNENDSKVLTFLDSINLDDIKDDDIFFKKLEEL